MFASIQTITPEPPDSRTRPTRKRPDSYESGLKFSVITQRAGLPGCCASCNSAVEGFKSRIRDANGLKKNANLDKEKDPTHKNRV